MLDLPRIEREVRIAEIDYHDELASTNTRALELAALADVRLPLLVVAERQLAGRGRGLNHWWSAPGALTFSLLSEFPVPGMPVRNWPLVSLTAALAVAEVIEVQVRASDVRIKWPNDVYVHDRKICGILVETTASRPGVFVLGIGINVNNAMVGAPPELRGAATSLIEVTGQPSDRTGILIGLLRRLAELLPSIGGMEWPLAEAWRARCLLQGRTIQLDVGTHCCTGVCQGIDDQGALLLLTEGGIQRCFGGTVARIF